MSETCSQAILVQKNLQFHGVVIVPYFLTAKASTYTAILSIAITGTTMTVTTAITATTATTGTKETRETMD